MSAFRRDKENTKLRNVRTQHICRRLHGIRFGFYGNCEDDIQITCRTNAAERLSEVTLTGLSK